MGLSYNGNGNGSWNDVLGGGSQTAPQQPSQGGQRIKFYNIDQQQAQGQPQQKAPVPKVPKKELQGMNWLVANMNN